MLDLVLFIIDFAKGALIDEDCLVLVLFAVLAYCMDF